MSAILPFIKIDSQSLLSTYFTPYQMCWVEAEDPFHEAKKQVFALAEKSVRIGWTFCDGFKNVRKRLRFKNRDYLFATKDWPSALEYMKHVYEFADMLGYTRAILSHGEDFVKVKSIDQKGEPTSLTEEIKIGYIKFQNGSRIIAFSSNPYAMAVYGGDVGLDEFAKHPNAKLLWQTAQARVTWAGDLAVWSSHDGEDTLFNQFAQEARATCLPGHGAANPRPLAQDGAAVQNDPQIKNHPDPSAAKIKNPLSPWNLYFRVTMPDAVELGLLDVINRTTDAELTPEQFLADCQSRSGSEEIYQQSYLCNPLGAAASRIAEWSAIERCRRDYEIERVHLEGSQILRIFGQFHPGAQQSRQDHIEQFLCANFPALLDPDPPSSIRNQKPRYRNIRLGFDIAASGEGDLAAFYFDEASGSELVLRALLTVRTEDWHFLKTVLFYFLRNIRGVRAAGDESGLGRQICWEATKQFWGNFTSVNFASKKHDLGFSLMNQLSVAEKCFPKSQTDIAADFFALRKVFTGTKWIFTEGRNTFNPASHCDIAWAGALSTFAHSECSPQVSASLMLENGTILRSSDIDIHAPDSTLISSDDPRVWRPMG